MRILFLILAIIIPSFLFAQYGGFGVSDARSMGMGNTGNAYHHEILPISKNPAVMALSPDTSFFRIVIPNFSTRAAITAMPLEDFNYFFGGDDDGNRRVLDNEDKQRFLGLFDDTGEVLFSGRLNALAVSFQPDPEIGAFGFSIHDYGGARLAIDQELADVLLFGNQRNRTYDFDETALQFQYTRSYQFRYSRYIYHDSDMMLKSLYGGIALKYYQGFAYTDLQTSAGSISTNEYNQISGSFSGTRNSAFADALNGLNIFSDLSDNEDGGIAFPESVGSGIGFDIGFVAEIEDLDVSIGVTDIGSMTWDTNAEVEEFSLDPTIDGLYKNDKIDTLLDDGLTNEIVGNSFESPLATTLRIGFHLPVDIDDWGDLDLALDYNQGFDDTAVNSTMPRISAGAHWQPGEWIPSLLTGLSNDRTGSIRWALGIGYETPVLDFYIATNDLLNSISPDDYASVAFTFAFKVF